MKPLFVTVTNGVAHVSKQVDFQSRSDGKVVWSDGIGWGFDESGQIYTIGGKAVVLSTEDAEAYRALVYVQEKAIAMLLLYRQELLDVYASRARPVRREDVEPAKPSDAS